LRPIGSQHVPILTNHLANALLWGAAAGAVVLLWARISLSLLLKLFAKSFSFNLGHILEASLYVS
jgi:hypothetical protein